MPIVFIGSPDKATQFYSDLNLKKEKYSFYTVEPVNALKNDFYARQYERNSTMVVGPGTAGCSLAHTEAQIIIKKHFITPPSLSLSHTLTKPKLTSPGAEVAISSEASLSGGFIFESDAILSRYGRRNFSDTVTFLNAQEFKVIQLGGLKSTSGRKGQKINIFSSLRNYFLSNVIHDLYEDIKEFLNTDLSIVQGWIGGSHAYYIHTDAIDLLQQNQVGFLNSFDDYLRTLSWNTNWVGRTRQNLFIQSDTPSLIKEIGR